MTRSTARRSSASLSSSRPKHVERQQAKRGHSVDTRCDCFVPGEVAHVYRFGGPNVPRYLGVARVRSVYDAKARLYVVRLDEDSQDRVMVVARSLQGNPARVLADLKAHWAARITTALFGEYSPDSRSPENGAAAARRSKP